MPKLPLLLLAGLFPALWGCSSAPIHYHTLVPAQAGSPVGGQIRIDRVSMPPQVDRAQIVIRQGGSGLAILETEWWGANLTDEFRNALEDQLGAPGTGATLLRVDVQRFDSVPGQYALLDARWRFAEGRGRRGLWSAAAACGHLPTAVSMGWCWRSRPICASSPSWWREPTPAGRMPAPRCVRARPG